MKHNFTYCYGLASVLMRRSSSINKFFSESTGLILTKFGCLNKMFLKKNLVFFFHFTMQGSTGLTPPKTTFPHFFSLSLFFLSLLFISSVFYLLSLFHPKGHSRPFSPLVSKKCTQVTPISRRFVLFMMSYRKWILS